ncbi:MAG: RsmE family RNA methyltransferase [Alphaproteobacteria bacterium]|nr:RsmE family RNA methyltransferase [Alphaproteobacteria bacterium]MDD9920206.1 RsmE family RNA methyltransferase [Alphaproteobacteria bacterium]
MSKKQLKHVGSGLRHFYVDAPLTAGGDVEFPTALSHRLGKVLRLKKGDSIALFNGKDGLFSAVIGENTKFAEVQEKLKSFETSQNVTLMVGLPKRETMNRVLRQATELGVARIQPVLMEYCVPDKLNLERVEAIAVEAAEQCERLDVPKILKPMGLREVVESFDGSIYWAAERKEGGIKEKDNSNYALLVGPEGGFSPDEASWLVQQQRIVSISLGTTILRVDTAVVAGLGVLNLTAQ